MIMIGVRFESEAASRRRDAHKTKTKKKTKEKRLKSFHGACEPSGNRRRPHTAATKWYTIRNDGIKGVTQPFHSTKKKTTEPPWKKNQYNLWQPNKTLWNPEKPWKKTW